MQTLSLIPECRIDISTVEDGPILSYEDIHRLGLTTNSVVYLPEHRHGTDVVHLTKENKDTPPVSGDIVVTSLKNVRIAHQFADCVPFLCIDRKRKVFVFSHLGWKGLVGGGVHVSIASLLIHTQGTMQDLWIWIGPCIQKASYTFTESPLQTKLPSWEGCADATSVDLPAFIMKECSRIGIDPAQVINDGRDTFSLADVFYSHRRFLETGENKGTFIVTCSLE